MDTDAGVSPQATDWCDGLDNDCDGSVDGPFDSDADSWATCLGDCDDGELTRFPQPVEPDCSDGFDGDCDERFDAEDEDCPSAEGPPVPLPRPYGLSCSDCQGSLATSPNRKGLALALFFLALLGRRLRLRPQRRLARRVTPVLLAGLALLVPEESQAARKESALVVYLSPQPDIRHMVEARDALPRLDTADVLHTSELFDVYPDDLVVVGASATSSCPEGSPEPSLSAAAERALEQVISFDNLAALRSIDDALEGLACLKAPMPPGVLPRLLYYRGVVDHNLGRTDKTDSSFERLLAVAPDFPGDPNFPPAINTRLDELRARLGEKEGARLMLFAANREGLRVDGRRIDEEVAGTGLELQAGEHVVQISRGSTTQTLLLSVQAGQDAVVLHPEEREQALLSSSSDPAARAFTRSVLGMAAAEENVSLVVVLDLNDGTHSFEFRPEEDWFSFDGVEVSQGGSSRRAQTQQRSKASQSSTGKGRVVSGSVDAARSKGSGGSFSPGSRGPLLEDRVRLRLAGGYLYVHPFSYVHLPLDVTVHLWRGLCVDFGGEWSGSPEESSGLISLPAASAGISYRLSVNEQFQLRFGALGRLSADRQEGAEARPLGGWAVRVGGDILPPGTRLMLAFDVQGGMLGKPFYLNGTFGLGLRL